MLVVLKNKVRFESIAAYIGIWVFGTHIIDKLILVIVTPYVDKYIALKPDVLQTTNIVLYIQSYYIAVFHLLVVITTFIVFFNKKYKSNKRELGWAYLIIITAEIIIAALNYLLKTIP